VTNPGVDSPAESVAHGVAGTFRSASRGRRWVMTHDLSNKLDPGPFLTGVFTEYDLTPLPRPL
jgi:hypothetical protein